MLHPFISPVPPGLPARYGEILSSERGWFRGRVAQYSYPRANGWEACTLMGGDLRFYLARHFVSRHFMLCSASTDTVSDEGNHA